MNYQKEVSADGTTIIVGLGERGEVIGAVNVGKAATDEDEADACAALADIADNKTVAAIEVLEKRFEAADLETARARINAKRGKAVSPDAKDNQ